MTYRRLIWLLDKSHRFRVKAADAARRFRVKAADATRYADLDTGGTGGHAKCLWLVRLYCRVEPT
eukprot:CAMPEP_0183376278 /NCGR_PEP_ID=MMETSP0164_2-20130417/119804_1 /TAXON_ID=221442 /ORGANISM="Coccolithus pelagicus ssp braarudi, Strain PLY182g" /LENGTH=64 /DNA_ID=CAMNT_0025553559 /DNA_START=775 /DNA_END=969 /DNA_ORIENTATION=-